LRQSASFIFRRFWETCFVRATYPPCRIDLSGQSLELLPERALWWPEQGALFIADLHLGKAATFRALGQPVPSGTTQENLARIDRLIDQHRPRQLVFLGDFLHAAQARTPGLLAEVQAWRARHRELTCTLVRGNHDGHAGDPPASLDFSIVDEPHVMGPFAACHHPQVHPTLFVLAGHFHPACTLHGKGRDSLRMPCFVREAAQLILPAFGEFTGGWQVESAPGRRLYGVGGEAVWAMPA
jgi:DNA ligase-associated metallophosphoesterase